MHNLMSQIHFSSDLLETLFDFLTVVKYLMALFGSLVILTGSVFVVCQFLYRIMHSRHNQLLNFDLARLGLTRSIVLGLEFIIAADLIQTTTSPSYYDVGILAALTLIRAFMNYFLSKDLINLSQREEEEKRQLSE